MNKYIIAFFLVVFISFFGCKDNSNKSKSALSENDKSVQIIEQGKEIASSTFLSLSSELQNAMKSGGIENAFSYCNLNALNITDSLSNAYNVYIRRTSMKFRNPKNAPSEEEKAILLHFENRKNSGAVMKPRVVERKSKNTFYAPIIVQDLCLKCHGPKEDIEKYELIKELYPNDLAFGYSQGDLRGMWSIEFRK